MLFEEYCWETWQERDRAQQQDGWTRLQGQQVQPLEDLKDEAEDKSIGKKSL